MFLFASVLERFLAAVCDDEQLHAVGGALEAAQRWCDSGRRAPEWRTLL